jgi:coatomer subunit beta'
MVLQVITNVHTNNRPLIRSAKFIPREHWIAIGDHDGWVRVYAEPTEEKIKEFEAHRGESVSLLAVHSTYSFLLTSSFTDTSIKLWDWDQDWMCTQTFNMPNTGLFRLMWNPIDGSTTFAGVSYDKSVKVCIACLFTSNFISLLYILYKLRWLCKGLPQLIKFF